MTLNFPPYFQKKNLFFLGKIRVPFIKKCISKHFSQYTVENYDSKS
jgi:hypothetical protein